MRRPPSHSREFGLVEPNNPIEQIAAVAVPVAQRDAERPWRHQRTIHGRDRERHWQAIIGAQSRDNNGMRHIVEGDGQNLGRVEIHVPARVFGIHMLTIIILARVFIDVEARLARVLALDVAVPIAFMAAATTAPTDGKVHVVGANDVDQVKKDAPRPGR
jgi:hypothetical protein